MNADHGKGTEPMRSELLEREAEVLRARAVALGDLLAEKCVAYGGAHNRQTDLWRVLLLPYADGKGGYVIPEALVFHIPRLTRVLDRVLRIVAHPVTDPLREDPWTDLAGDALAGVAMPKPVAGPVPCLEPGCELHNGHGGKHEKFDAAGLHRWGGGACVSAGMRDPLLGEENPRGFDPALDVAGGREANPISEDPAEVGEVYGRSRQAALHDGAVCGKHFHNGGELCVCSKAGGHEGPHVDMRGREDPSWKEPVGA